MFEGPDAIYEQISSALFRAALYVSQADKTGGASFDLAEIQSLSVLMHVMREQHSSSFLIQDVVKRVHNHIRDHKETELSDFEMAELSISLEKTPQDIELAVKVVLEHFPQNEAELYTNILIAAAASVAQTQAEDVGFLERIAITFNEIFETGTSKYLYHSSHTLDKLKISAEEADALDNISNAVKAAWKDYAAENNNAA